MASICLLKGSIYVLHTTDTHGRMAHTVPEDGASRDNARRKVFAALGARRVPIAHLRVAAAAGAGALVLATRRVLGPVLD